MLGLWYGTIVMVILIQNLYIVGLWIFEEIKTNNLFNRL